MMQRSLWIAYLCVTALPALGADCIYYKDGNRAGEKYELTANGQVTELPSGWNDTVTSLWIRNGYYSLVTQDFRFIGTKLYFYGSGLSFAKNIWQFDQSKAIEGGAVYEMPAFGFDNQITSLLCLKE